MCISPHKQFLNVRSRQLGTEKHTLEALVKSGVWREFSLFFYGYVVSVNEVNPYRRRSL